MSEWKIYHADGTQLTDANGSPVTTHALEYSGTWMGECFVTVSFKREVPIEFSIGDWLSYRDERFEINYDPGKIKCASSNSYGEAFQYNDVKFNALSDELVRAEFLDVVLDDNQLHYTALPKFAFYVSSLDDLLDRIQANMDEQYGSGLWHFFSRNKERSVQRGCAAADWEAQYGDGIDDNTIESQSLSASSNTCWEALAWVNSTFDVNFIIRNRNVFVGTAGIPTNNIFKYGKGNGLYQLEQSAESDQLVCTRLRAYGSDQNLPSRYYAELDKSYKASILSIDVAPSMQYTIGITFDVSYQSRYFSVQAPDTNGNYGKADSGYVVTVRIDGIEVVGNMTSTSVEGEDAKKWYLRLRYQAGSSRPDYTTLSKFNAVKSTLSKTSTVELVEGFSFAKLPTSVTSYGEGMLPDNMAVSTLMLPGFPKQSLQEWWDAQTAETKKRIYSGDKAITFSENKYRPYVDSPNKDVIGVRPSSVFFDTDDETNGIIDIYPTIEEMEVDGVRIDEINEGTETTVTDNGVFSDGDTIPNFTIYLSPKLNFNINDLKDDDFTIHLKDGMCGGREFKVEASTLENGRWKLTLQRQLDEDIDLYFPYKDFPIKAGDHFVLTGIELPDEYVEAASEKLLKYAIAYLNENDYTRYVYSPKVDEIFMARQHDEAMADTSGTKRSLYLTLKEGDIMLFRDTDLGIDAEICIDQLSIKEADGKLPTFEVTLREDKEVGTIQKIQNQVSSLISGNGGSGTGGGITSAQVKELIATTGSDYFVSKVDPDEAAGEIAFEDGIAFGAHDSGRGIDKDGNAALESVTVGDDYGITSDGEATLSTTTTEEIKNAAATISDRALIGGKGFDMYVDGSGHSHLWVDELDVRMKAYFAQLEIRKVSYSGGTTIFSNAGSTIVKVVNVEDAAGTVLAYKCYAKADDGTTATANWWKVGMQALCKTFNIAAGKYSGVSNRYYWRLVIGVGQETLSDGLLYDYVVLSNLTAFDARTSKGVPVKNEIALATGSTPLEWGESGILTLTVESWQTYYDSVKEEYGADTADALPTAVYGMDSTGTDAPQPYDVIVQVGDQLHAAQYGNVIVLSTSAEDSDPSGANAPCIRMWHAIASFRWTGLTAVISPAAVKFNTAYFQIFSGDDDSDSSPMTQYCGQWLTSVSYQPYQQVTYDGQLWTRTADTASTKGVAPSETSGWTLTVASGKGDKGDKGDKGESGADGTDGWSFLLVPGIISLSDANLTENTTTHAFSVNSGGTATPMAFYGGQQASIIILGVTLTDCTADFTESLLTVQTVNGEKWLTADGEAVTDSSGSQRYIPVSTASVEIVVEGEYWEGQTVHTARGSVRVDIAVSFQRSLGTLTMNDLMFKTQFTAIESTVETVQDIAEGAQATADSAQAAASSNATNITKLTSRTSTLEQTADKIQTTVSKTTQRVTQAAKQGRNLIPRSMFHLVSSEYGNNEPRRVYLEKGKTYTLMVRGHIDSALKSVTGGMLVAFVYPDSRAWSASVAIDSLTTVTKSVTWTHAQDSGYFNIDYFPVHTTAESGQLAGETGHIFVEWAALEEADADTASMQWSAAEADTDMDNLLPELDASGTGWGELIGTISEQTVCGRELYVSYLDNSSGSAFRDMLTVSDLSVEQNKVYCLSMWVKGSGQMNSFFYCPDNSDSVYGEWSSDGYIATYESGNTPIALTSDWRRVWVVFTAKQTVQTARLIVARVAAGSSCSVCGMKLEQQGTPSDYGTSLVGIRSEIKQTAEEISLSVKTELAETGIDIENRRITATTDTFIVQNNAGETTVKVNADGVLETSGGVFNNITAVGGTFNDITAVGGTFSNIVVNGSTRSPWVQASNDMSTDLHDNVALHAEKNNFWFTTYKLPWTTDQSGRRVTLANYTWDGVPAVGYGCISAPNEQYFFENGQSNTVLYIAENEVVELLGYGDDENFYGWIVANRKYVERNLCGQTVPLLMMGYVYGGQSSSQVSSYIKCWGGSTSVTVLRSGKGIYRVYWPAAWATAITALGTTLSQLVKEIHVQATGIGYSLDDSAQAAPIKATVWNITSSYVEFHTSDDTTVNDGAFFFEVKLFRDMRVNA